MYSYLSVDYVVNYAIVGYIIFHLQSNTQLTSEQRLTSFTTGSYALLYLINAFSTLIDTTKTVGEARGLQRRLSELLLLLRQPASGSTSTSDSTLSNSFGSSSTPCVSSEATEEGLSLLSLHPPSRPLSLSSVLFSLRQFTLHSLDGERVLLKSVSFDLLRGMRLLVCGPSGCGKSTLLNALNLLLQRWSDSDSSCANASCCQFNIRSDEFAACSQSPYCFHVSNWSVVTVCV